MRKSVHNKKGGLFTVYITVNRPLFVLWTALLQKVKMLLLV